MPVPQPWVYKARELVAAGKPYGEIARIVGQTPAHVQMRAGPRWKAYKLKDLGSLTLKTLGFKDRPTLDEAEEFVKIFPEIIEEYETVTDRQFLPVKMLYNGVMRPALRIECSKKQSKDCLVGEDFLNKNGAATSPVHAANVFRNHGWVIGGGPRADICPKCYKLLIDTRREKYRAERAEQPMNIIPQGEKPVTVHATGNGAVSVSDPQPLPKPTVKESQVSMKDVDKTAKRLIDGKLDEVYNASKGGYLNGYTDDKLAVELGVMKEWVSLVRDFGHGPETSALDLTADVKLLDAKAQEVREAKRLVDAGMEAMTRIDKAMNDRLANFEAASTEFQKVYNALRSKVANL